MRRDILCTDFFLINLLLVEPLKMRQLKWLNPVPSISLCCWPMVAGKRLVLSSAIGPSQEDPSHSQPLSKVQLASNGEQRRVTQCHPWWLVTFRPSESSTTLRLNLVTSGNCFPAMEASVKRLGDSPVVSNTGRPSTRPEFSS